MAEPTATPGRRPAGIDPNRLAKRIRRLSVPILAIAVLALYLAVGLVRVPAGLDSMFETHPPGSLCLIRKSAGAAKVGSVVFARVADGVTVSRVVAISPGENGPEFLLRNDNPESKLPDGSQLGELAAADIVGVVLVVFPPEVPLQPPPVEASPEGRPR